MMSEGAMGLNSDAACTATSGLLAIQRQARNEQEIKLIGGTNRLKRYAMPQEAARVARALLRNSRRHDLEAMI